MPTDPNLPIPQYPVLEPTSALAFSDLILEVAYKIGCAYYGSDGTSAPQIPIDAHDLALCQRIVNKAMRKFINDGPKGNGWRWLNVITQTDLWPQISYDPNGGTFVSMVANPTVGGVTYSGCTLLTLSTPAQPPLPGDIDTSYVPRFLASMELRQIWLFGNPPSGTPGWWLPIDENFTGPAIGSPFTILRYISPTQIIVDGNATSASASVANNVIAWSPFATSGGGAFKVTVTNASGGTQTIASDISVGTNHVNIQNLISSLSNVGSGNVAVSVIATNAAFPDGYAFKVSFSNIGPSYVGLGAIDFPVTGNTTIAPFSFACQGDYTLPANFGGQYTGPITYVANTNRGMILSWTNEIAIRSKRQNYNIESGTPYEAAVRLIPTPSYQNLTNSSGIMLPRHRWELMTWRISSEFLSVLFPYTLSFNSFVNLTDIPPSPIGFDETLKACCLAVAEKETEDTTQGVDWEYYHQMALPAAWELDMRSAPKAIGYFGNPTAEGPVNAIKAFRDIWYQRPVVPVFGRS